MRLRSILDKHNMVYDKKNPREAVRYAAFLASEYYKRFYLWNWSDADHYKVSGYKLSFAKDLANWKKALIEKKEKRTLRKHLNKR